MQAISSSFPFSLLIQILTSRILWYILASFWAYLTAVISHFLSSNEDLGRRSWWWVPKSTDSFILPPVFTTGFVYQHSFTICFHHLFCTSISFIHHWFSQCSPTVSVSINVCNTDNTCTLFSNRNCYPTSPYLYYNVDSTNAIQSLLLFPMTLR